MALIPTRQAMEVTEIGHNEPSSFGISTHRIWSQGVGTRPSCKHRVHNKAKWSKKAFGNKSHSEGRQPSAPWALSFFLKVSSRNIPPVKDKESWKTPGGSVANQGCTSSTDLTLGGFQSCFQMFWWCSTFCCGWMGTPAGSSAFCGCRLSHENNWGSEFCNRFFQEVSLLDLTPAFSSSRHCRTKSKESGCEKSRTRRRSKWGHRSFHLRHKLLCKRKSNLPKEAWSWNSRKRRESRVNLRSLKLIKEDAFLWFKGTWTGQDTSPFTLPEPVLGFKAINAVLDKTDQASSKSSCKWWKKGIAIEKPNPFLFRNCFL